MEARRSRGRSGQASISETWIPSSTRRLAVTSPTGPAPTMRTRGCDWLGMEFLDTRARDHEYVVRTKMTVFVRRGKCVDRSCAFRGPLSRCALSCYLMSEIHCIDLRDVRPVPAIAIDLKGGFPAEKAAKSSSRTLMMAVRSLARPRIALSGPAIATGGGRSVAGACHRQRRPGRSQNRWSPACCSARST